MLLAFIGLLAGFVLGTGTLLGPIQWAAGLARERGWTPNTEDSLVRAFMVALVVLTFIVGLLLTSIIVNSRKKHIKLGLPLLLMLFFAGTLYMWLTPGMLNKPDILQDSSKYQFTVGSYPDKKRLRELKRRGYTSVISLLHPAVVPFEPKLLADEQKAVSEAGLELIHMPMLPWISENKEALEQMSELARSGKGRYYIHCYLGKDRVNVARNVIKAAGGNIKAGHGKYTSRHRHLADRKKFERGPILSPDKGLHVTPHPTDEEYLVAILVDDVRNVISLLDSERLAAREHRLLEQYHVNFHHIPISIEEYNPKLALAAAQKAWRMPRPLVVHSFHSPSPRTDAFIQAFLSNRAPLPPSLFDEPLRVGKVTIIAPHIAVGPRPTALGEFKELEKRGIRKYLFIGDPESPEGLRDEEFTRVARFDWRVQEKKKTALKILNGDGPWYVYGSGLARLRHDIAETYGPAMPTNVTFNPAILLGAVQEIATVEPVEKKPEGLIAKGMSFIERALPSAKLTIILVPLSFFYALLAAMYVGRLKKINEVRTPYTRKIFHFLIFTMASVVQLTAGLAGVMIFGSVTALCVLYAVMRGQGFPFYEAMARPTDEPHRSFYILVPLLTTALGGVISNLFFIKFAYIGYLVGGWGDAIGEPVGSRWGKHRYKVPSLLGVNATRSLEGSLAVFSVSFLAAVLGLTLGGFALPSALACAALCAVAGALVESVSTHGLDNLTIQVTAAGVAAWMLGG